MEKKSKAPVDEDVHPDDEPLSKLVESNTAVLSLLDHTCSCRSAIISRFCRMPALPPSIRAPAVRPRYRRSLAFAPVRSRFRRTSSLPTFGADGPTEIHTQICVALGFDVDLREATMLRCTGHCLPSLVTGVLLGVCLLLDVRVLFGDCFVSSGIPPILSCCQPCVAIWRSYECHVHTCLSQGL